MHALTSILVAAPAGTPLGDWLGRRHNDVQAIVDRFERAEHLLGQSWSDGKDTFVVSGFWRDGRVLVHQEGSSSRSGDQIVTVAEVAELKRLAEGNASFRARQAEADRVATAREAERAAALAAKRPHYAEFLATFSPMQRAKVHAFLDAVRNISGTTNSRVDHAYDFVRKGFVRRVQGPRGDWRLANAEGTFYDESTIGKTLVDFVLFLAGKAQEDEDARAATAQVESARETQTRKTAAELRAALDAFDNAAMRGPGFTQHHQKRKATMQREIAEAERREKREARAALIAAARDPTETPDLPGLVELPAVPESVTDAPVGTIFVFNFPGNTDSAVRTPSGFAMPATSEAAAKYQGSLREWTTLFGSLMGTKTAKDVHVYRAYLGKGKLLGKGEIERIRDEALAALPEIPDSETGRTRAQVAADKHRAAVDEVVALYKEAAALAEAKPASYWAKGLPNVLGVLRDVPGQEFYRSPPAGAPPAPELTAEALAYQKHQLQTVVERLKIETTPRPVVESDYEKHERLRAERAAAKQAARVAGYRGDIPWSVAGSAHAGTSHVPDDRGQQELDSYQEWLEQAKRVLERAATTPEALARLSEVFDAYRDGYRQRFTAYLSSHAQVVSSMVAGRSNFPVARMQKRGDAADKRRAELLEWRKNALASAVKSLTATNIEATGGPLAAIERNIQERLNNQERYKAINAIVKGKGTATEKAAKLEVLGLSRVEAVRYLTPDFAGRKGVPSYALQNNLKEIRRLEARLEEEREKDQRAAAAVDGPQSFPFDGGTVEYDYDDDRLRIRHATKPPTEVIAELRSRGFKWSPTNTAWQRQLTENAIGAARFVTKAELPWLKT